MKIERIRMRTPPHNIEAERGVIGSILLDPLSAYTKAVDAGLTSSEQFYDPRHQVLFDQVTDMVNNNKPIDAITIFNHLKKNNLLEKIGGQDYLVDLQDSTLVPAHVQHYAEIVVKLFKKRVIIDNCCSAIDDCYGSEDPEDVIKSITDSLDKVNDLNNSEREVSDFISKAKEMDKKILSGERVGLPFPWDWFDHRTMGIPTKSVTPIAGRDKGGKSWLAAYLAQYWLSNGIAGLYLPFEDTGERFVKRLSAIKGGYDNFTLKRNPPPEFVENHFKTLETVNEYPLQIEDLKRSTKDIVHKIAKCKRKYGIEWVVIDGFKDITKGNQENATQQENAIMAELVKAASEYDVSIIPIMHLTKVEDNVWLSKRNIKGSGTLFQSARMILMFQDQGINEVVQHVKGFTPDDGCIVLDCPSPSYGDKSMIVLRPEFNKGRFVEVTGDVQTY